jgi:hypothetical protein
MRSLQELWVLLSRLADGTATPADLEVLRHALQAG